MPETIVFKFEEYSDGTRNLRKELEAQGYAVLGWVVMPGSHTTYTVEKAAKPKPKPKTKAEDPEPVDDEEIESLPEKIAGLDDDDLDGNRASLDEIAIKEGIVATVEESKEKFDTKADVKDAIVEARVAKL